MQPKKEQLSQLLERYLQGIATPEEVLLLQRWLPQLDIRQQKKISQLPGEEEVGARMWQRIRGQTQPEDIRARRHHIVRAWIPAAAASLLALFVGLLWFYDVRTRESTTPEMKIIATDGGTTRTVTLADGTVVRLNRYTTLELDENYNQEARRVRLTGEAFFDVRSDTLRPFVVTAYHTETRVTGTTFNIEAYDGEAQVRVALLSGKITVNNSDEQSFSISPGELFISDRDYHTASIRSIDTTQMANWRYGKLTFIDVPLPDVILRLRPYLSFEIELDPNVSFQGKGVTGEYKIEEAREALDAILLLHDIQLKRKGGTYIITDTTE